MVTQVTATLADIHTWDNLYLAYRKAAKGKRSRRAAAAFEYHLEDNLIDLQDDLTGGAYTPGAYASFTIHEPKRRLISAAPFRDRVVHHALCNLIEPAFERSFIHHSYANRIGKGTHRALDTCQAWAKRYPYVLQCDVRQFFPSIDHGILEQTLQRRIQDPGIRRLIALIVASGRGVLSEEYDMVYFRGDDLFAVNRPRGLPIGNLTSQLFGNYYLNGLDHFIKETLGCKYIVRYVDDFVVLDDNKEQLQKIKAAIGEFLQGYRLLLHENKSRVYQVKDGVGFLGHRVFPGFRLVKSENVHRFRKRLKGMLEEYRAGNMSRQNFNARVRCWFAHIAHSNTWRLRRKIYIGIYGEKIRQKARA